MPPSTNGHDKSRYGGIYDPILFNNLATAITNEWSGRQGWLNDWTERSNVDKECGFPEKISAWDYRRMYDRNPIAARVVELMPKESWQVPPTVYEDEDAEQVTDFEKDWDELPTMLRGDQSWYKDEEGSPVWEHVKRADIASRIAQFGILLLGFDDGKNLQDPVDGVVTIDATRNFRFFDAPLHANEEAAILALKDINDYDKQIVANWKNQRELISNKISLAGGNGIRPGGTEAQYSAGYGVGMPAPGATPYGSMSGTDQQYFGVQYGPTEQPANKPSGRKARLLFMRAYDESLVQIVRWEWNIFNPRFGMPVMYRVTLNDPRTAHSGIGLPLATVYVHWSRVIHIPSGDRLSSEVFGIPDQQQVWNNLLDLHKLYGGSAEGYWLGAFGGISIETHPQLGGDVLVDKTEVNEMMAEYYARIRRSLLLKGMSAKSLAPQVSDPTAHINAQIGAICIRKGCPVRVFMGTERGELASGQDDDNWNERKREVMLSRNTPLILIPLIDRLIAAGVLSEPKQYSIKWPDLEAVSKKDKATIALTRTQALQAYVSGNVETIMAPTDYLTRELDYDEEEAEEIIEAVQSHLEESYPDADSVGPGHAPQQQPDPSQFGEGEGPPGEGKGTDDEQQPEDSGVAHRGD